MTYPYYAISDLPSFNSLVFIILFIIIYKIRAE